MPSRTSSGADSQPHLTVPCGAGWLCVSGAKEFLRTPESSENKLQGLGPMVAMNQPKRWKKKQFHIKIC